ncbi:MAG: hypothetical protein ABSH40_21255 [Bryobacteraceae bacterium]
MKSFSKELWFEVPGRRALLNITHHGFRFHRSFHGAPSKAAQSTILIVEGPEQRAIVSPEASCRFRPSVGFT